MEMLRHYNVAAVMTDSPIFITCHSSDFTEEIQRDVKIGNFMLKIGRTATPKKDYTVDYQVFEDLRIPLPKQGQGNHVKKVIQIVTGFISKNFNASSERILNNIVFELFGIDHKSRKKIEFCSK
jgi:hypothetical protein